MLRRKLLVNLGPLVLLLLGTAVAAVWPMEGLLGELDRIDKETWQVVESLNTLSSSLSAVEIELQGLESGGPRRADKLVEGVKQTRTLVQGIGASTVVRDPRIESVYEAIVAAQGQFEHHAMAVAATHGSTLAPAHAQAMLVTAMNLRQQILPLSAFLREHAREEHERLGARFRVLVLGLTVVFLVVINISVVVVLRTARMVLQPIERLIDATGQLAQEHYDYRVQLDQADEFGQLAQAFNHLAAQLEQNETRKIEVMGQVALTMNHELNNALAIIDLQLERMRRHSGGNAAQQECLKPIRTSLARMTRSVHALKNVRRIVLTDYADGRKMLDLDRSSAEWSVEQPPTGPTAPQAP